MALINIPRLDWYNRALSHVGDYVLTTGSNNLGNPVYTATHTTMKVVGNKVFGLRLTLNLRTLENTTPAIVSNVFRFPLATANLLPVEVYAIRDNLTKRFLSFSNFSSRTNADIVSLEPDNSLYVSKTLLDRIGTTASNLSIYYSVKPDFNVPLTTAVLLDEDMVDAMALGAGARLATILEGDVQKSQLLEQMFQDTLQSLARYNNFSYQKSYFV